MRKRPEISEKDYEDLRSFLIESGHKKSEKTADEMIRAIKRANDKLKRLGVDMYISIRLYRWKNDYKEMLKKIKTINSRVYEREIKNQQKSVFTENLSRIYGNDIAKIGEMLNPKQVEILIQENPELVNLTYEWKYGDSAFSDEQTSQLYESNDIINLLEFYNGKVQ